jgi:hypothetical protein
VPSLGANRIFPFDLNKADFPNLMIYILHLCIVGFLGRQTGSPQFLFDMFQGLFGIDDKRTIEAGSLQEHEIAVSNGFTMGGEYALYIFNMHFLLLASDLCTTGVEVFSGCFISV